MKAWALRWITRGVALNRGKVALGALLAVGLPMAFGVYVWRTDAENAEAQRKANAAAIERLERLERPSATAERQRLERQIRILTRRQARSLLARLLRDATPRELGRIQRLLERRAQRAPRSDSAPPAGEPGERRQGTRRRPPVRSPPPGTRPSPAPEPAPRDPPLGPERPRLDPPPIDPDGGGPLPEIDLPPLPDLPPLLPLGAV